MSRSTVLVVAPMKELPPWEEALRARGYDVARATSAKEARAEAARQQPAVVLVSEKLPMAGALRVTRELRQLPATREAPVVIAGILPLTTAQRMRLKGSAPDGTVAPGASAEDVAAAVAEAQQKGKLPPVVLTPAQEAGMKYNRIGTLMMLLGVIFSMPGAGGQEGRAWMILLIPAGGLVSDYATGKVDGRKQLITWQGWVAMAIGVLMAIGLVFWPQWFRWPTPHR